MLKEEIKNIKQDPKDLRKFGLTVGTVLVMISVLLYFYEYQSYYYLLSAGFLLIAFALAMPEILRPLNKVWMTLALAMGWVMTRVILSVLYYLVITPIGLAAKIAGKDFLNEKKPVTDSYWNKRESRSAETAEYERQF